MNRLILTTCTFFLLSLQFSFSQNLEEVIAEFEYLMNDHYNEYSSAWVFSIDENGIMTGDNSRGGYSMTETYIYALPEIIYSMDKGKLQISCKYDEKCIRHKIASGDAKANLYGYNSITAKKIDEDEFNKIQLKLADLQDFFKQD